MTTSAAPQLPEEPERGAPDPARASRVSARTSISAAPSASVGAAESPERSGPTWRQLIGIPLNVLLFLLLMVMSWGSWNGFFAHPARTGVVVIHLLMLPVMTLCTSGRSRGVAHVADWRPFFPLLMAHSLFTCCVLPYMDARNIFVLPGGDALRWIGLAFLAAGAALRIGPMIQLGRRFVSVVAVRADHALTETGFYAQVRHPSYLGILLLDVGFALVFRSVIAVLVLPVVFWMFKRRMDVEEAFLVDRFGDEYGRYMAKTRRLLPGVY
jgi:protein-S-isoprenylcysteine O-methyltransferase Ste14